MTKDFKTLLLTALAAFTLAACGTATTDDTDVSAPETSEETRVFTSEELSQFDGENGNPANGEHNNDITAGNELSSEILQSPHSKDILEDLPVVGTLEEE